MSTLFGYCVLKPLYFHKTATLPRARTTVELVSELMYVHTSFMSPFSKSPLLALIFTRFFLFSCDLTSSIRAGVIPDFPILTETSKSLDDASFLILSGTSDMLHHFPQHILFFKLLFPVDFVEIRTSTISVNSSTLQACCNQHPISNSYPSIFVWKQCSKAALAHQ